MDVNQLKSIFDHSKDTFKLSFHTYAKTGFNPAFWEGDTWINNDSSITFKIEHAVNLFGISPMLPVRIVTQTPCAIDHGVRDIVLGKVGDKQVEDIAIPLGGVGNFGYSQLDGVLHVVVELVYADEKAVAVKLTFSINDSVLNAHKDLVKSITLDSTSAYVTLGTYMPPIPSNKPNPIPQPEPTPGGTPKPTPQPEPIPSPAPSPTPTPAPAPQPNKPNTPSYGQYTPGTGGGYQPTGNYNAGSSGSGIDTKTMLMIGAIAVVAIFIFLKK